ncbi:MAG: AAA domain-containing protein [Candidatus Coproplasma sp.]
MAKMIPSAISPNVKSSAERKIYEWFKNDPVTKDWVVFHSLGIENHQTVVFGEIDFLVCASNLGVFALEVKGGRISRKDGVWVYTDKYGIEHEKVRGPFEQASEGMYSVKQELQKRTTSQDVKNALCGYGVMFPDIEYVNSDIDVAQQEIFDRRDGQFVGRYIKRLADYTKNKFRDKRVFVVYPSEQDINEIVNVLRRDFDKALPLSTKLEYSEKNLISLTDEQYRCIDGLALNKRCLINGSAGTGKTILAIKHVKDSVVKGKKVGFFCFNKLLARELKRHFENDDSLKPDYIGSLTEYAESLVRKHRLYDFSKIENLSEFYKETLPVLALDAIGIEGIKFDKIVIDEAQDLMTDGYLMVIDALLNKGLKKGEWFFFGDFDYQTIYNRGISNDKIIELLEDEANFSVFNLTVNCRNSVHIQNEMNKLFELNSTTLKKDKNLPEVKYVTYKDEDEEARLLERELEGLIKAGISEDEITILSPFKRENSVVQKLKKYKIGSVMEDNGTITYSTIQGFKGLENTVIILTDIQTYNKPDLMYVAMSRARSMLIIFETEHAKTYRENMWF